MKYRSGKEIEKYLSKHRISVKDIHLESGVVYNTTWKFITGKTTDPRQNTRIAIEAALQRLLNQGSVQQEAFLVQIGIDPEGVYFDIYDRAEQRRQREGDGQDDEERTAFMKVLAEKLRVLIAQKNISTEKICASVGINEQILADQLQAKTELSAYEIVKYAKLLEVSCEILLDTRIQLILDDYRGKSDQNQTFPPGMLENIIGNIDKLSDEDTLSILSAVFARQTLNIQSSSKKR